MVSIDEIRQDSRIIFNDLMELIRTPGPSGACAKMGNSFSKLDEELPMTTKIREIVDRLAVSDNIKTQVFEHHGNIVLAADPKSENPKNKIRSIPIALGAHIDEITFFISNKWLQDSRVLIPLCSPPSAVYRINGHPFMHEEAKILGFRDGSLKTIGFGRFRAVRERIIGKEPPQFTDWIYLLKVEKTVNGEAVKPGDVVIQNYEVFDPKKINAKALDDRVGTVVALHAMKYLCKENIPMKCILSGDEEGVNLDVSWARLILPTYRDFCQNDVVTVLCDGIDGRNLSEFIPEREGQLLPDALLVPYTSHGKGGGDYRLFSEVRDNVVPICEKEGYKVTATTDYVSRSFDPKIMNEYPRIVFLDWSNGEVRDEYARCHFNETILFEQVLNLIGATYWTAKYLLSKK